MRRSCVLQMEGVTVWEFSLDLLESLLQVCEEQQCFLVAGYLCPVNYCHLVQEEDGLCPVLQAWFCDPQQVQGVFLVSALLLDVVQQLVALQEEEVDRVQGVLEAQVDEPCPSHDCGYYRYNRCSPWI